MVKLSDFLNSPWRLTTHRPRPCFIRNLILQLQWLVKRLLALEKKVSVATTTRYIEVGTYPDEQLFQLLYTEGMALSFANPVLSKLSRSS
jgi:hypothetical protein